MNKGEGVGGGGASLDGGTSDPEGPPGLDPLIKLHGDIPTFESDWPPPLIFFLGINGNMSDELSLAVCLPVRLAVSSEKHWNLSATEKI